MCFSSTASFSAGVALLILGVATTRRVRAPAEFPFALIPALFGFQQLLEGMLWLSFPDRAPSLNHVLTQVYSVFSQVIWPIYVPISVYLLEPIQWRRKALLAIAIGGAAVSLFLLYYLVHRPVVAVVNGHHITYIFPHFHEIFASGLYLMGACIAPLLSSHRHVRLFGVAVTFSLVITFVFYGAWFISVWCFFAALWSGLVYLHFSERPANQSGMTGKDVAFLGALLVLALGAASLALADRLALVLAVTLSAVLAAVRMGL